MANITATPIRLEKDKETPGTYRFKALDEDAVVNQLYIRKSAFPNGAPQAIEITVAEG